MRQAAERADVSYSLISKIESGQRGISDETRTKLLVAMGIPSGDAHVAETTDYEALVREGDVLELGKPGASWVQGRIYTVTSDGQRRAVVALIIGERTKAFRALGSHDVVVLNSQHHTVDGIVLQLHRDWS